MAAKKLRPETNPPASDPDPPRAPRTSMAREREPRADDRPTAPPPGQSATTECLAWHVVADLLANVQREVDKIAAPTDKRRLEAELRPLARAVTQWHTVAPQPAQCKSVLELLLQIQDAISERKTSDRDDR